MQVKICIFWQFLSVQTASFHLIGNIMDTFMLILEAIPREKIAQMNLNTQTLLWPDILYITYILPLKLSWNRYRYYCLNIAVTRLYASDSILILFFYITYTCLHHFKWMYIVYMMITSKSEFTSIDGCQQCGHVVWYIEEAVTLRGCYLYQHGYRSITVRSWKIHYFSMYMY